ncbi:MAG: TetR/AcrR family transcriptional regulator C-terminal domain-containing protein [Xanthomonadaceae bacterium]|nr:TetR/AcrR family transcriptional regulator C-terminal domain-containing protein [Xanthomonadaceae bacterium]
MSQDSIERSAILEASIDELSEKGLEGSSLESVAERTGLSQEAVARHVGTKQALFEMVVDWMVDVASPVAQLRYDPARPFAEQLRELAVMEMALIYDPRQIPLSRVLMFEAARSPDMGPQVLMRFAEKESNIHRWFVDAAADGKLGDLAPDVAADTFTGLLKTPYYWMAVIVWQPEPDADTQNVIIDRACEFLLCRIAKPVAA